MADYAWYRKIMDITKYDDKIERYIQQLDLPQYATPKILDIGCASGISGITLAKRFPGAHVVFTDIRASFAQDAMDTLSSSGDNSVEGGVLDVSSPDILYQIQYGRDSIKRILEKESFDIVVMGGVLGYSSDVEKTLETVGTLMKEGGTLINLEMTTNPLSAIISAWYKYTRQQISKVVAISANVIGETQVQKIGLDYFPVNLTRTSLISRKS